MHWLVLLVLLTLNAPRPTHSQFGGQLGDSGPQLGKLTDTGPQLGKLPVGGGGGQAQASFDDGNQALQDMLRKQFEAQGARGYSGAGAAQGGVGPGLSDDMSSFFKQQPSGGQGDTGSFEPSKLAQGGGGGGGGGGISVGAGSGMGSFNPSKLSSGDDSELLGSSKQEGSKAPYKRDGSGSATASSQGQKPRPWETGSSAKLEATGGRGSAAGSRSGGAWDTLEDLDSLAESVGRSKTKKVQESPKTGKNSWLDTASSWFQGKGADKKGHKGKSNANEESSGPRNKRGGAEAMQAIQNNAGMQKKESNAAGSARSASASSGKRAGEEGGGMAGSSSKGNTRPAEEQAGVSHQKADPLRESEIEKMYRKLQEDRAKSDAGGAGARSGGAGVVDGGKDEGLAPMSSLEPPSAGAGRSAGADGSTRPALDTDAASSETSIGRGEDAHGSSTRRARSKSKPAPPPAENNVSAEQGHWRRGAAGKGGGSAAGVDMVGRDKGGAGVGDGSNGSPSRRGKGQRKPRPPPAEGDAGVMGSGHTGDEVGERRRRSGRPAPPPLEGDDETSGGYSHYGTRRREDGYERAGGAGRVRKAEQLLLPPAPVDWRQMMVQLMRQMKKALSDR